MGEQILLAAAPTLVLLGLGLMVLPQVDPRRPWPRMVVAAVAALLLVRYILWRVTETLPAAEWSLGYAAAVGFLGVETLSSFAGLLLLHVLSRTKDRSAEADSYQHFPVDRFPDGAPLIDVLIPTYNENREILLRTLVGALAQDYPLYRVWVLDDGRRPWLQEIAQELGANYLTRADNAHGKAGNMNAALRLLLALPDKAGAVAVLDADFVPAPQFLRRSAALLQDPAIGCVQTPQYFFNPDPIQLNLKATNIVADEQRFFFDVILASKDAHGTAFSCGTSAVVRVNALEQIGLFPTESVTEDLLLSVKMTGCGWRTAYLNEPLSAGLAPEGMQEYLTQRGRWCLGTMQIVRTPWGPLSRGPTPLMMRLHTLDTVLFWTVGSLIKVLALLVPPLYWWFGLTVMQTDLPSIIAHLGPYWVVCVGFLGWVSRGTNVPVMAEAVGILVAREAMRASVIGLFGSRNQKFKVTAKGTNRDQVVVQWSLVGPFLLLALATMGGLVWRVLEGPLPGTPPDIEVMNLFWSIYNCAVLFIACMICVEQPRFRREERFDADEAALLTGPDGAAQWARLRDLSILGARVEAAGSIPRGSVVRLFVEGVGELEAEVRRATPAGLHLAFAATQQEQAALIRKVFSGAYLRSVTRTPPGRLVATLARRAFS
ncbi:glycosyltransferase [Falsiroseomonas sp. HC035]|uniref:glycosyltransferase n=1 Tax=Falsiroseomonas sp. HC035 TaxID=3390999 RepID=UPI003D322F07